MSTDANRGFSRISKNRMANSVDPDETAHEPSHQDLQCLHRYLFTPVSLKGLMSIIVSEGVFFTILREC